MIYNLFISHSWTYSNQYEGLIQLLNANPYFKYKNYSVPKKDPICNAIYDWQLKSAIEKQMRPTSCVLIFAGVYSTNSKWINIEIKLAKDMDKKIIAVIPRGNERRSTVVISAADQIVGWNTNSIISAIRGY